MDRGAPCTSIELTELILKCFFLDLKYLFNFKMLQRQIENDLVKIFEKNYDFSMVLVAFEPVTL